MISIHPYICFKINFLSVCSDVIHVSYFTSSRINTPFSIPENVLPSLQVPENVTVTSNVTTNFSVNARDPGDTVTYKLVHDGSGALQINPTTGEITATVNHQQPVNVQ